MKLFETAEIGDKVKFRSGINWEEVENFEVLRDLVSGRGIDPTNLVGEIRDHYTKGNETSESGEGEPNPSKLIGAGPEFNLVKFNGYDHLFWFEDDLLTFARDEEDDETEEEEDDETEEEEEEEDNETEDDDEDESEDNRPEPLFSIGDKLVFQPWEISHRRDQVYGIVEEIQFFQKRFSPDLSSEIKNSYWYRNQWYSLDGREKYTNSIWFAEQQLMKPETDEQRLEREKLKKAQDLDKLKKEYKVGLRFLSLERNSNSIATITKEPFLDEDGIIKVEIKDNRNKMSIVPVVFFGNNYISFNLENKIDPLNVDGMPLDKKAFLIKQILIEKGFNPEYVELEWDAGELKLYLTFNTLPSDEEDLLKTLVSIISVPLTFNKKTAHQLIYDISKYVKVDSEKITRIYDIDDLEVGDLVQVTGEQSGCEFDHTLGRVAVKRNPRGNVGIDFAGHKSFRKFHDLNGAIPGETGYWIFDGLVKDETIILERINEG